MASAALSERVTQLQTVTTDRAEPDRSRMANQSDRISELYHRRIWNEATQDIARERIHWICGQARGRRALDVGCSQGITSILLAREGFEVVGVDSDPEVIGFAQAEAEREAAWVRSRLTLLELDLRNLEDQTFDTVIAGEVIEHQANPRRFLEQCARFVGQDGLLVLTTPFGLHPHPDHKVTLYPRQVVEAVAGILTLEQIDVVDGYIRLTAVRRADAAPRQDVDQILLRLTERGALAAQTRLFGLLEQKTQQLKTRSSATEKAEQRADRLEQEKAEALARLMLVQKEIELREADAAAAEGARAALSGQLRALQKRQDEERAGAEQQILERRAIEAELARTRDLLAAAGAELDEQVAALAQARAAAGASAQQTQVLDAEAQSLTAALTELEDELRATRRARESAESEAARAPVLEAEVARLETALWERHAELQLAHRAREAAEAEERLLFRALEQERTRAEVELQSASAQALAAEQQAAELRASLGALERERGDLLEVLGEIGQEVDQLAGDAKALRATIGQLEAQTVRASEEAEGLRREMIGLEGAGDQLRRELEAERTQRARAEGALAAARGEHDAIRAWAEQAEAEAHRELEAEARQRARIEAALASARSEHDDGRARADQAQAKARREVERLRRLVADLELKLDRSRQTISFRLGYALLQAGKSFGGFLALPRELAVLRREARVRRRSAARRPTDPGARPDAAASLRDQAALDQAVARAAKEGPEAASAQVLASDHPAEVKARLLTAIAKTVRSADPTAALEIGRRAYQLDPKPFRARWLASLMYDGGLIDEPAGLAECAAAEGGPPTSRDAVRAGIIEGLARVRQRGFELPVRAAPAFAPIERRILYVVHRSLPQDVIGYTTRSQGLLKALIQSGLDMRAVTRVGYPDGHRVAEDLHGRPRVEVVDGVPYARLDGPSATSTPLDRYVDEAAAALATHAREVRPMLIHAASNHVNALPALIAARRLGLPFVYEVRGLWEYTSASRIASFEQSERFALMRDLECLVAREADLVLTLSGPLKSELIRRGVPAGKISLAPNAVDVEHFRPMAPDPMLGRSLGLEGRFVIGFLGSLTNYEGLEDLVAALAGIVQDGIDAALLIVGDGDAAAGVRAATQRQGLTDRVVMVGRVPSADVPRYYALIDVAAFPRLPFKVCELVPPLKPFEAMAMAKPVIASDLPALAEVVEHGKTGLLFPSGDRAALAAALRMLAEHPARREALGTAGRDFVMRERTWMAVAAGVRAAYAELFEAAHAGVFEQAA